MPVEATENVAPVVFWRKELREDSGGAGRTRGGCGQIMEIGAKGELEFAVNATFDRIANAPRGRDGGVDGRERAREAEVRRSVLRTKGLSGDPRRRAAAAAAARRRRHGRPEERDPALVARDVRDGLLSVAAARAAYKVVVAADGTLDQRATAALRS